MITLIGICAVVGAVVLLLAIGTGITVLADKWRGMRPILPSPDRSVMRYGETLDEMARYRARLERQGVSE
jgi:hypothetical protein